MLYVLISVICSVIVSVIIKIARQRSVNYLQLLVWNYPIALILTYYVLSPRLITWRGDLAWSLYLPLGFLLPVIFICIAMSIRYSGIVKTEVSQRLSLFIPLIAAFLWMNEVIVPIKFVGIALGLIAIVFSISWNKTEEQRRGKFWIFPLSVFFGMGIIDVLFKQIAQLGNVSYMSSLWIVFVLSTGFAFMLLIYLLFVKKQQFDRLSVVYGAVLGLFNFANIVFYMKAHRSLPDNPSLVFTGMNIGVIVLGALVGVFIFKEKLSYYNKIGVILAVISVLLIAFL